MRNQPVDAKWTLGETRHLGWKRLATKKKVTAANEENRNHPVQPFGQRRQSLAKGNRLTPTSSKLIAVMADEGSWEKRSLLGYQYSENGRLWDLLGRRFAKGNGLFNKGWEQDVVGFSIFYHL